MYAIRSYYALFVWGLVTDYVLEGPSVIRTAFIITDTPETVAQAVFEKLGLGVTAWTGKGRITSYNVCYTKLLRGPPIL